MFERDNSLYVLDILIAGNKIERYIKEIESIPELFNNDPIWDATIRELTLIGEAVNILIKDEIIDHKYRRLVDFRNMIVHGYFGIDEDIVWDVVKIKLPQFITELWQLVQNGKVDIKSAVLYAKKERHSKEVQAFLNSILETKL
jgi:uncharacterized protein with HEPN domain